jgi:hypothetical protein
MRLDMLCFVMMLVSCARSTAVNSTGVPLPPAADTGRFRDHVFPWAVVSATCASPVLGYFFPQGLLSLQRMLLFVRMGSKCTCDSLEGTLRALNPIGIEIPPYERMSFERGALASNFGIIGVFAVLVLVMAIISFTERGSEIDRLPSEGASAEEEGDEERGRPPQRAMSLWETLGWCHFPGVLVVPFAFLIQPIVRSIARLLVDRGASSRNIDVASSIVAGLALLLCFAHVAFVVSWSNFSAELPETSGGRSGVEERLVDSQSVVKSLRRRDEGGGVLSAMLHRKGLLIPMGHWVYITSPTRSSSSKCTSLFLRRYGKLFLQYDGGRQWTLLLEFSVSIVFGVVEGSVLLGGGERDAQNSVCNALRWLLFAIAALKLVMEVVLLPYVLWASTALGLSLGLLEAVSAAVLVGAEDSILALSTLAFVHIVLLLSTIPLMAISFRVAAFTAVSATSRRVVEGSRVGGEVFDNSPQFINQVNVLSPSEMTTNDVLAITRRASQKGFYSVSSPTPHAVLAAEPGQLHR